MDKVTDNEENCGDNRATVKIRATDVQAHMRTKRATDHQPMCEASDRNRDRQEMQ